MIHEEIFRATLDEIDAGRVCVLATVIEVVGRSPSREGAKMLLLEDGSIVGTVGGGALEKSCLERARTLADESGAPVVRHIFGKSDEEACGGQVTILLERIGSAPVAALFGSGHVVRALAYYLAPLAFRVVIYDDRSEALAALAQQPGLTKKLLSMPFAADQLPAGAFAVVAGRSHEMDYEIVRALLGSSSPPQYVGMVGSRRKTELLLDRLREDLGEFDRSRLYAPCGLNISGSDPQEIALAIVAEILSVKAKTPVVGHLRDGRSAPRTEDREDS